MPAGGINILSVLLKRNKFKSRFIPNCHLSGLTTIRTGGPCRALIMAYNEEELISIIMECIRLGIHYKILGNGSNVLFSDRGFNGVIIKLTGKVFNNIEICKEGVLCGAGVSAGKFLKFCLKNSIGGYEFFCGIPGTIGGMLCMNAGAFSCNIGQFTKKIKIFAPERGIKWIEAASLRFLYRKVKGLPENSVILQVLMKKKKSKKTSFIFLKLFLLECHPMQELLLVLIAF